MDYRIAICDDDKEFCSCVEDHVLRFFSERSMKTDVEVFYSGEALADSILNNADYDFIILDIVMFELNGVDIGKLLRRDLKNFQTQIIYVSSKTMYAMELFKVQPLDFLEKPVDYDELSNTLENGLEILSKNQSLFSYSLKGNVRRVRYSDILYFESRGRKIVMNTPSRQEVFYGSIKNLLKELPDFFVQIHRSYIVNVNAIISNKHDSVVMIDECEITIGKNFRDHFNKMIMRRLR